MSSPEKIITRREFTTFIAATLTSAAVSAPLVMKFVKDAQAIGRLSVDQIYPQAVSSEAIPTITTEKTDIQTGVDFLTALGLKDRIVYIVYGRPKKSGEQTWGSIGESQTAEQSWQVYQNRKQQMKQVLAKQDEDFALNVVNPVFRAPNGEIKPIYIQKGLELAAQNVGLLALNFNSFTEAEDAINRLESSSLFPDSLMRHLAVGLDIEHFPGNSAQAEDINRFTAWFAQKHQTWSSDLPVPGLVIVYTFSGGRVLNLGGLKQYYLPERTLVVPIFDGYGTAGAKLAGIAALIKILPSTESFPALVGVMEFNSQWDYRYDKSHVKETFAILEGAPTFFFASQ